MYAEAGARQGGLTWLKVSDMFLTCFRDAKVRLDTSSLALLASGVTQKATKKVGMPDACRMPYIPWHKFPGSYEKCSKTDSACHSHGPGDRLHPKPWARREILRKIPRTVFSTRCTSSYTLLDP